MLKKTATIYFCHLLQHSLNMKQNMKQSSICQVEIDNFILNKMLTRSGPI